MNSKDSKQEPMVMLPVSLLHQQITLRDFFAGMIAAGIVAHYGLKSENDPIYGVKAIYDHTDAILQERDAMGCKG